MLLLEGDSKVVLEAFQGCCAPETRAFQGFQGVLGMFQEFSRELTGVPGDLGAFQGSYSGDPGEFNGVTEVLDFRVIPGGLK